MKEKGNLVIWYIDRKMKDESYHLFTQNKVCHGSRPIWITVYYGRSNAQVLPRFSFPTFISCGDSEESSCVFWYHGVRTGAAVTISCLGVCLRFRHFQRPAGSHPQLTGTKLTSCWSLFLIHQKEELHSTVKSFQDSGRGHSLSNNQIYYSVLLRDSHLMSHKQSWPT